MNPTEFLVDIPGWKPARVWRGVLADLEPIALEGLGQVRWRAANEQFLGRHQTCMFGRYRGRDHGRLPGRLREVVDRMVEVTRPHTNQAWTTAFTGKFQPGDYVRAHRDPLSNIGYTAIAVFGSFQGAVTTLLGQAEPHNQVGLQTGDLLLLPCTIHGRQGPYHRVSKVLGGTRYTLILNTVR